MMRLACLSGIAGLAMSVIAQAANFEAIRTALGETKPIVDTRLRFENVDQNPLSNEADAVTLRARLGFETGKAWQTALLVEGEFVWPLRSDYNSTTNGKTAYPSVSDPESYEINRLQLVNSSIPKTALTVGRQRITLDDQRFVGNSGWRQNEQTFDSLRIVNKAVTNLTFDLAYVEQVNRVFGKRSPQGRYQGDSFLANVAYALPVGKLTAFGYWIDIDPTAAVPAAVRDSSETFGLRFAGERPLRNAKLAYAASYATQQAYGDNPLNFDNDYYLLDLTGTYRQYFFGLGLETLEGNGVKGFTTAYASLHPFQGWADKFLATPPNGVEDRYLKAGVSVKSVGPFDILSGQASYHRYQAQRVSLDYGSELDVQLQVKWNRFLGTIKFAQYAAAEFLTDTTKFWAQLEYSW